MNSPLLILYGSQTGNAQDVAERLGREAALHLFTPRVLAMDSYDVGCLPQAGVVLFVASTTGQGEAPDNMRRTWRFLLRKGLPADALSALNFAVFGLGDSGYPQFNVTAKKLAVRLQALGARPLLPLGLGDDAHPTGYEAALDAWSSGVWGAIRRVVPLPPGVEQPVLTEAQLLQLGRPKYRVTFLGSSGSSAGSSATAAGAGGAGGECDDDAEWEEAVAAAAAFRRVAAAASGCAPEADAAAGAAGSSSASSTTYGPWRPFFAPVTVNRRLTAPDHFQDTRHIEVDLTGSGLSYEPGDLLCVLPRPPRAAVDAMLERLGLRGEEMVEVAPADAPADAAAAMRCSVRALLRGVLDIAGASPRRFFFQVLAAFTSAEMQRERLQYFATAEGRDDLYRYNQREGRTVLEVLCDFNTAAPPLEWLLEACPHIKPRQFSIASSSRLTPHTAALTVAVVRYTTPYKRTKTGLCSSYLASLMPTVQQQQQVEQQQQQVEQQQLEQESLQGQQKQAQQQQQAEPGLDSIPHHVRPSRVAVWVERGALRLPPDHTTPLVLIGPGTGVAPFRSFLEERYALLQQRQRQGAAPADGASSQAPGTSGSAAAASGTPAAAAASPISPSHLFFGCRSAAADFYYSRQWEEYQAAGVLHPGPSGLVLAASRDQAHKVYVQHKIREHGAELWRLLHTRGAHVYVSGSAQKMPAAVAAAFEEVVVEHGGMGAEEAKKYVRRLELTGRYHVEAWS